MEESQMSNLNTIYHYCSIDTFMAIIQNRCLRLCDLNKTNDYMEKKWSAKLIESSAPVNLLKEELKIFDINMNLTEDYWYQDGVNNHLQYYDKEIKNVLYNNRPILITCFSKEKDLLSQWRAYGQDGEGIALGFNYKILKQLNRKASNMKFTSKNISVEEVVYKENKQKEKLSALIQGCIMYIQNMFEDDMVKISDDFSEYFTEEFDAFCEVLVDNLENISCTIKNTAFSEEKEVRIVYDPQLVSREVTGDFSLDEINEQFKQMKEKNNFIISPIKYTKKLNQLVAFCDLDFSKLIEENIINEIIIGPKSNISEDDIYNFMLSQGYDANNIEIKHSKATYR
ncbi:DUF2971 domain-containing protein [Clostridium botulinum]|nr:DUF2971 domain-containing protein [Clostridium botulinum]